MYIYWKLTVPRAKPGTQIMIISGILVLLVLLIIIIILMIILALLLFIKY